MGHRLIVVKAPRGEALEEVVSRRALPGEFCSFAELTTPGDELVLRYERAEPEVPEAVEVEVEVFVAEPAAEVDHPLCGLSAKQAKAWVEAVAADDVDGLADALAAEVDGRKRKSVIALLKARLAAASD